jgi:hypothetical protein
MRVGGVPVLDCFDDGGGGHEEDEEGVDAPANGMLSVRIDCEAKFALSWLQGTKLSVHCSG